MVCCPIKAKIVMLVTYFQLQCHVMMNLINNLFSAACELKIKESKSAYEDCQEVCFLSVILFFFFLYVMFYCL